MVSDLDFAVRFVEAAGGEVRAFRLRTARRKKINHTDVAAENTRLKHKFIYAVQKREGNGTAVKGEKLSHIVSGARRMWVIDPIDGVANYIDGSIPDRVRTCCVAVALFVDGKLVLSVVCNPFRQETFIAQRGKAATLNGRPLTCSTWPVRPGVPYDYYHCDGAPFEAHEFEQTLGQPRGVCSAIYQACEVASGRSAFAILTDASIGDAAPGALMVAMSNRGVVTDLQGRQLDWSNLTRGVIYATRASHSAVLRMFETLRR